MRRATVLQVFAASPSDVQEERDALEGIVAEVNQMRASASGIRLELVRWETHSRPGFGADAQDVLNRQLPDDYDIFLGILWTRFGTPTGRADSGTEEEFNRAFERFHRDPHSISIMMYFKEGLISPNAIDPEQLAAVRRFRNRIKDLGGLVSSFRTTEEFQALLRAHLASEITDWETRVAEKPQIMVSGGSEVAAVVPTAPSQAEELTEDLGFLDHLETAEDKFVETAAAVVRIGEALTLLTERTSERTAQIEAIPKGPQLDVRAARRVAKRAAEDLEQFVARATVETPIMSGSLQEAIESFGNAATFAREEGPSAGESLLVALQNVTGMRKGIEEAASALSDLRATVGSTPRIQKDMTVAKRKAVAAFDALLAELQTGINLSQALEDSMRRLIEELGGAVRN